MPAPRTPTATLVELSRMRFASRGFWLVDHQCAEPTADGASGGGVPPDLPTLGFVRCGIGIIHVGRRIVHADANQVVLFSGEDEYRVEHRGCQGHRCAVTLRASPDLFNEAASNAARRWEAPLLPRAPRANLALHRLLRLTAGGVCDPLGFDELALRLLDLCLFRLDAAPRTPVARGREAGAARLVDRAKEVLSTRSREPLQLAIVAREVGCSAYHLCHVFKAATGATLSQYVHRLRIDEAFGRLREGERDLTTLAADLGFASHSHFTAVFRRELGSTPSEVRRGLSDHRRPRGAS